MKYTVRMLNLRRIAICCSLVLLSGCATIGDSSVELSGEIGARIAEMQAIHMVAVEAYFDVEKGRIEDFLDNTWEPLFLQNFLGTSGILRDLEQASILSTTQLEQIELAIAEYLDDETEAQQATARLADALRLSRSNEQTVVNTVLTDFVEDDRLPDAAQHVSRLLASDEPARMILDFAEDAHEQMQLQRRELLQPLERERARVTTEVQAAYAELTAAQGLITGRLAAASRIRREQDQLFSSVVGDGSAERIRSSLSDVSEGVGSFLACANQHVSSDSSNSVGSADLGGLLISVLAGADCSSD